MPVEFEPLAGFHNANAPANSTNVVAQLQPGDTVLVKWWLSVYADLRVQFVKTVQGTDAPPVDISYNGVGEAYVTCPADADGCKIQVRNTNLTTVRNYSVYVAKVIFK